MIEGMEADVAFPFFLDQAFDELCKPSATPSPAPGTLVPTATQTMSPLNCFLGCLYLRRHLQTLVRQEPPPAPQLLQSTDPNTVAFKVDSLTCRVSSRPENAFQTLHLKIEQDPPPQVQVRREKRHIDIFGETAWSPARQLRC